MQAVLDGIIVTGLKSTQRTNRQRIPKEITKSLPGTTTPIPANKPNSR
jgi:hypothetical protein